MDDPRQVAAWNAFVAAINEHRAARSAWHAANDHVIAKRAKDVPTEVHARFHAAANAEARARREYERVKAEIKGK